MFNWKIRLDPNSYHRTRMCFRNRANYFVQVVIQLWKILKGKESLVSCWQSTKDGRQYFFIMHWRVFSRESMLNNVKTIYYFRVSLIKKIDSHPTKKKIPENVNEKLNSNAWVQPCQWAAAWANKSGQKHKTTSYLRYILNQNGS